jgi:antitoxin component YwqK of YwqJK toxin-antitoxin module
MIRVLSIVVLLLSISSLALAQGVNPARTAAQQRGTQPPVDGKWNVYDRDGNLVKEETYQSYRLHGDVKTFFLTGAVKAVTPYIDGSRQGLERTYYSSGSLESENWYVNNNLQGTIRDFYETGELKRVAEYTNGQLDGLTKLYYENGSLKQIWNYNQGIMHGSELIYNEDGQIQTENNYQNGMLVAHKDYTGDNTIMKSVPAPLAATAPATDKPLTPSQQQAPAKESIQKPKT